LATCGTTEVVPCYKARNVMGVSAGCSRALLQSAKIEGGYGSLKLLA
jgi:hypothetical protein